MNTVSIKVNVPTSREIMGNKKRETPVNYEQELANTTLAEDCGPAIEDAIEKSFLIRLLCMPIVTLCDDTGHSCY